MENITNTLSTCVDINIKDNLVKMTGLSNINESLSTHYLIYRITNNINGKYYIGQHETKNPYDGYMGSGKIILDAEDKYGLSAFTKTILFDFDNFDDMNDKEKELVQLSNCYPQDLMSYNLREGGSNGKLSKESCKKLAKTQSKRLKNLPANKRKQWIDKLSLAFSGENNPMFGDFEHTKGFRAENERRNGKTLDEIWGSNKANEIREKTSKSTTGENNGCFGKRWLHNPNTKDKVYVQESEVQNYIQLGYIEGTGLPTSKGYKWINNGIREIQVSPEKVNEYITNGWNLGKMKSTRKMIDPITGKHKFVKPQQFENFLKLGYVFQRKI